MFIGIGAVALVLLLGAAGSFFASIGSAGSPRPVAQKYVTLLNQEKFSEVASLVCSEQRDSAARKFGQISGQNLIEKLQRQGVPEERAKRIAESVEMSFRLGHVDRTGTRATADVNGTMSVARVGLGQDGRRTRDLRFELVLVVESGAWKLCGVRQR